MPKPLDAERLFHLRGVEPATLTPAEVGQAFTDLIGEVDRLRADLASYQSESAQYDRDHERLSAELKQARAEVLTARAAGYRNAFDDAAELLTLHGADFDTDMLLVVLKRGAELREAHAATEVARASTAEPPRPSPAHMAVYIDQHNGTVWVDYPTVPSGDDVLPLVTANETTTSRADLADQGVRLRIVGWIR
jgi:hypothetical protein